VGRPQLAPIATWQGPPADRMPTVLYAPTWEGWDDNPGNTSILLAGENIVRTLVQAEPAVRVLYKPHPFTGTRSARAKAAHQRITALVEKAAAERAADPRFTADASAQEIGRASCRERVENAAVAAASRQKSREGEMHAEV